MTYNVYLSGVGMSPVPALDVLKSGIPLEKVYLLNNSEEEPFVESERQIRQTFIAAGIHDIITLKIDPYDFNNIVENIMNVDVSERELHPDVRYHMNFTSGTRIMSGAIVCASMMLNADLCYMKNSSENPDLSVEEQIIFIQPANMVEARALSGELKEIFMEIASSPDGMDNSELNPEIKRNTLTYHTKKLVKMGLIINGTDGRSKRWYLTEKGKSTKAVMGLEKIPEKRTKKGPRRRI